MAAHHPFLQPSPYAADAGALIGRDPREISAEEWAEHMPETLVGLSAIRANCLGCCNGNPFEVRKCTVVTCSLWPLRMGSMPTGLRNHRRAAEEAAAAAIDRESPEYLALRARFDKARAARGRRDDDTPDTDLDA